MRFLTAFLHEQVGEWHLVTAILMYTAHMLPKSLRNEMVTVADVSIEIENEIHATYMMDEVDYLYVDHLLCGYNKSYARAAFVKALHTLKEEGYVFFISRTYPDNQEVLNIDLPVSDNHFVFRCNFCNFESRPIPNNWSFKHSCTSSLAN